MKESSKSQSKGFSLVLGLIVIALLVWGGMSFFGQQEETYDPEKFGPELPISERIRDVNELASEMKPDSMKAVFSLFPDLRETAEVAESDDRNLMKIGEEAWYYSADADLTTVADVDANRVIYVFEGNNPGTRAIEQAQEQFAEQPFYLASVSETEAEEFIGDQPFALYFHADWCPTCRKMEKDIKEDLASFPTGTKFIEVNYDTAKSLKEKYNVTTQSTIVILDQEGNAVDVLNAPNNMELKEALMAVL